MKKIIMFAAIAAMLVSCGGKPNMKFGDNEYAVRTIGTQSTELQNNYPATIRGIQDVEIRPKISGFISDHLSCPTSIKIFLDFVVNVGTFTTSLNNPPFT